MRTLLLFGLILSGALSRDVHAQDGFVAQTGAPLSYNVFDRNGRMFVNPSPDVAGSPFYADDWRLGTLVAMDNYRYDSVKLRLNLQSEEVHVLDTNRNEIALAKGYIKEVVLPGKFNGKAGGARFKCGFPAIDALDKYTFYEVVSEGKCSLLHSIRKVISQQKDDLSGEVTKEYQLYDEYYVYDGQRMQRVKKDKAFILAALNGKRDQIEAFMDANKLKARSVDDIKRIIDYYNTLP
ncbi:MAG TPA: hypothetical protein VKU83_08160 [Puia sp.]|nr:hypothetical protein [Puia sp.]